MCTALPMHAMELTEADQQLFAALKAKPCDLTAMQAALNAGANANAADSDGPAIFIAMERNLDVGATRILMHHNANMQLKDYLGDTPLHRFAKRGCHLMREVAMMKYLLQHNAGIDARDNEGNTPLHASINPHVPRTTRLLLHYGASVDARNNAGETPLISAAATFRKNNIEVLLEYGAAIDAQDNKGKTAFHHAAQTNWVTLIKFLIFHSKNSVITDPQTGEQRIVPSYAIRDNKGRLPVHYATDNELIDLLEDPEKTYHEACEEFRKPMLKKVCSTQPMTSWLLNREIKGARR